MSRFEALIRDRRLGLALDILLWSALAGLTLFAFAYHAQLCVFPYQLNPNEGGTLQTVRGLLAGVDPWSPRWAPEYANMYGVGYPWLVALCSKLAPRLDLLVLMRLVAAGAMFFGLAVAYLGLRAARSAALPAAAACLSIYGAWLFLDTPSARPDALVAALYLVAIVWAWQPGLGQALFAGALAGTAFFVKPYGLLAVGMVPVALALQGRWRHAFGAGFAGAFTLGALTALVLWHFPHYFDCTILPHFYHRDYNAPWLLDQCLQLGRIHRFFLGGLVLALGYSLWKKLPLLPSGPWRAWAVLAALAFLALASGPGAHTGAWLTYYNQLLLPLALMAGSLYLLALGLSARVLALLLLLNGAAVLHFDHETCPPSTPEEIRAWSKADAWVAAHPLSMLPPLLTSIAVKHQALVADTEHTALLPECYAEGRTQLRDAYGQRANAIHGLLLKGRIQSLVCGGHWACPDEASMASIGYVPADGIDISSPLTLGTVHLKTFVPKRKPTTRSKHERRL